MMSKENKSTWSRHLTVSIRLQKALRRKRVGELEADKNFLLEMRKISREKLARELHDGLTQTVATLAMRVNYSRRLLEKDEATALEELKKVEDLTRLTAKEIRYMIFTLRPVELGEKGLGAALEMLAEKTGELFDLQIHLSLDRDMLKRIDSQKQNFIYLLIEEAVDFSRRKGASEQVWVRMNLDEGGVALLEVESDGAPVAQVKPIEDNRELDNLREHVKLVGGVLKVKVSDGNKDGIQLLLPWDEISSDSNK
jgi:signal transduction histidine kinase